MRRTFLLDTFLLVFCATLLIWPLFHLDYLDNWPSIESTFISDARMLGNHLPHPGWQPLWYCGTRFDYVYPPALRYGAALIAKVGGTSTARAYHLYTAFFYVFGITSVYWMVRIGTASRISALLASVATALLSPSFLLLNVIRHDSGHLVPQRLHVLMQYGEGPHISALCILPAALAASYLALRRWKPIALGLAALLCALVVSNNFYGANALAIFFSVLAWSVWVGERTWLVWARAAGISALAYGLCAFWLTPSYFRITLIDLKWVSQPGKTWCVIVAVLVIAAFCIVSLLVGKNHPEREWRIFVAGLAVILSVDVLGYFYFDFFVSGNSQRLVPELDLALILVFVEVIQAMWNRPKWRIAAAVILLVAFAPARHYIRHAWTPFSKSGDIHKQYEYETDKWLHENLPGQRVLPTGSVRFWFDAWFDNSQPDGGAMQGMLNQRIPDATWQILVGTRADLAILWLQALGTDAVVVGDATSRNQYRDFQHPEKFQGAAPVLFDDRRGTVIYRVPRVHPGIGRMVDRAPIQATGPIRGGDDAPSLTRYVSLVEDVRNPAVSAVWKGYDELDLQADASADQSILLQETYDPAWRAYENGKPLSVRKEPVMEFMLVDVPAGKHSIQMRFETPLENQAGKALFGLSLFVMLWLGWRGRQAK